MVRRASHRRSRPQFLPAGGIGGGVGSPGGREALVKGGGVQELGLQFQVGKFGLQLGQIAAGNSSFLLQNGQVVGPFKSGQGILFALEFAFQAQHLFGNGGQRVARHGFADVLLVGEVFPQEGVQIGRRVSWIGARRLDDEDRAFRRLFDSDNHLERIAVLADGNGIAARLPQARHGPPAQLFAAEQLDLRAHVILHVFGEGGAFWQPQFLGFPHRSGGNKLRHGQIDVISNGRAEAENQGDDRHPPVFPQESNKLLDAEWRSRS